MPLPSNDKQVGDIGHADDHNAIVNEINSLIAASALYLGVNNTASHSNTASSINSSLITGTVLASNIVDSSLTSVGSLKNLIVTGSVNFDSNMLVVDAINNRVGVGLPNPNTTLSIVGSASATSNISAQTFNGAFLGNATSASSIDWSQVTSRPSASPSLNPQIGISLTGPVTGNASAVFNNLSNAQVTITTQQNITINPQTVYSYTLQLSDVSKLITMNNVSENAIVIPLESSVNFPIGSKIDITQIGSGTSSVTFVDGVTLNSDTSKKTINAQYAAASLVKLGSDSWLLIGALK